MQAEETPTYLYKILSDLLWKMAENSKVVSLSAEDDAFIHFSKEDQLDRILTKYWSDVPKLAVLKIQTDKLEGELVYETNPGGTAKYYHLYRGRIPYSAIVEAKMIFRKTAPLCSAQTLEMVQVGDPVLRIPARELTKEEILSPEIQQLIEEMKETMRAAPGVGVAAPQIGCPYQLVVIEDMDQSFLTAEQIKVRERYKVPFQVVINPRIYLEEGETTEFFEGCLSVCNLVGIVPRARSVRVECLNERAEPVVIEAKGWYARILQHEIDHLNATLFIDRAYLPTVMTWENHVKTWKHKSIKEVKEALLCSPVYN